MSVVPMSRLTIGAYPGLYEKKKKLWKTNLMAEGVNESHQLHFLTGAALLFRLTLRFH